MIHKGGDLDSIKQGVTSVVDNVLKTGIGGKKRRSRKVSKSRKVKKSKKSKKSRKVKKSRKSRKH